MLVMRVFGFPTNGFIIVDASLNRTFLVFYHQHGDIPSSIYNLCHNIKIAKKVTRLL